VVSERENKQFQVVQYPIAEKIPDDVLEAEVKKLELLKSKSFFFKILGLSPPWRPWIYGFCHHPWSGTFIQGFPGGGEKNTSLWHVLMYLPVYFYPM